MAVAIIFNHHYNLDGIDYLPGDTLVCDELVAEPLLYSYKARLISMADPSVPAAPTYTSLADLDALAQTYAQTYSQSAYDVAVANGFVGTEAQWLASLQGDPGDLMPAQAFSTTGTYQILTAKLPSTLALTLAGNTNITLATGFPNTLSGTVTLIIKQSASGGPYSITWPAAIEWPNDAAGPAMPSTASTELVVHLFWTGTGWRGVVAGTYQP